LHKAQQRYAVQVERDVIGGVPVSIVKPANATPTKNRQRILINLHGGFFTVGAGMGGLVESIPIAANLGITVVSVDYRLGPEYRFPAASEDVAAVYRELLTDHIATRIGIFGASAGGMLTAMALAWLQREHLPRPGAAALLSAGATASMAGDSAFLGPASMGDFIATAAGSEQIPTHPPIMPVPYLLNANPLDPMLAPVASIDLLKHFPPTLLITGTRAFDMSATVHTHRCLSRAGVDATLELWDGMWHCFFYDVDLPESSEVYAALAGFFDRNLQ
jgi:acetyl esterase/lipase